VAREEIEKKSTLKATVRNQRKRQTHSRLNYGRMEGVRKAGGGKKKQDSPALACWEVKQYSQTAKKPIWESEGSQNKAAREKAFSSMRNETGEGK